MLPYSNGMMEPSMLVTDPNLMSDQQYYCTGDHVLLCDIVMDGMYGINPVSSVIFDPSEELIWSVSKTGHLTGYYSWMMDKYVSLDVIPGGELIQVLAGDSTVDHTIYALGKTAFYYVTKFGRIKQSVIDDRMIQLECISWLGADKFVMGGIQDDLLVLDIQSQQLMGSYSTGGAGCVILQESQVGLCVADPVGNIMLLDTRQPQLQYPYKSIEAHSGQISDFAVKQDGYMMVTCGWSKRNGSLFLDRLLKVYDLRFMRAMAPISVPIDPCFVRFVPGLNDRLLVASQTGHFQFHQWGETVPSSPIGQIISFDRITSLDISSSARCLIFGTEGGGLHLFSLDYEPQFNIASRPTEFADPLPWKAEWPANQIAFDDREFAVSSLPFALTSPPSSIHPLDVLAKSKKFKTNFRTNLSSDWPAEHIHPSFRNMNSVDPQLIKNSQCTQGIIISRKPSDWGNVWFPYRKEENASHSVNPELDPY